MDNLKLNIYEQIKRRIDKLRSEGRVDDADFIEELDRHISLMEHYHSEERKTCLGRIKQLEDILTKISYNIKLTLEESREEIEKPF